MSVKMARKIGEETCDIYILRKGRKKRRRKLEE
jgi:hypothetical protein